MPQPANGAICEIIAIFTFDYITIRMMKKILLILCLFLFGNSLYAQDIIVKRDASTIEAKIVRITDYHIEYKEWSDPEGSARIIPAGEVSVIKYQNGRQTIIDPAAADKAHKVALYGAYPYYQGEVAVAFGLGVGNLSKNRIIAETVHGVRISKRLFVGAGVAANCFYEKSEFYWGEAATTIMPLFVNAKGYFPIAEKLSAYISLDLGAAIDIAGDYGKTPFYTSVGPGIVLGPHKGGVRGDFSIRFQYIGKNANAILLRAGINF